jgi:hypothetical protein
MCAPPYRTHVLNVGVPTKGAVPCIAIVVSHHLNALVSVRTALDSVLTCCSLCSVSTLVVARASPVGQTSGVS